MTQRYMIVAISCGPNNDLPGKSSGESRHFLNSIGAVGHAVCMMDFETEREAADFIVDGIDKAVMFRRIIGYAEHEKHKAAIDAASWKLARS